MRGWHCAYMALVVSALFGTRAYSIVFADSVAEFSDVQGQENWFYGIFNQGPTPGAHGFAVDDFVPFDVFDTADGRWEATVGQVGSTVNAQFLNINQDGGHPTGLGPVGQDSIIWAVRRYVSEFNGPALISFDLRKSNTFNNRGGGITGRILVDGTEVFTQLIVNADGVGVQGQVVSNVNVGSVIDFAIDPSGALPVAGTDSLFSARADASIFSAVISDAPSVPIPEPVSLAMAWLGGVAAVLALRRRTAA